MDLSEPGKTNKTNLQLWLILAICVLPIAASTLLYLWWTPTQFVNHGELVEPVPLADVSWSRSGGASFAFDELYGRWVFVSIDDAACDEHCLRKLYLMRQLRLTQGKDADRIERVWMVADGQQPTPQTLAQYEGVQTIVLSDMQALSLFESAERRKEYIYLIDPLGNLMMRFPRDVDPSMMKKDVTKLLRVSSGWRQLERQEDRSGV